MTDKDPRCVECGNKRSAHKYRHVFVGPSMKNHSRKSKSEISQADRIAELEGKLEVAMEGLVKAEDKINELVYMADPLDFVTKSLVLEGGRRSKPSVDRNPKNQRG